MAQLVIGEDKTITFKIRDNTTLDPVDLTGRTVQIKYINSSGTIVTVSATVTSAVLGTFTVAFTDTLTNAMNPGDLRLDVESINGGDIKIYPVSNAVLVVQRNS
jgi:hypothetical protein